MKMTRKQYSIIFLFFVAAVLLLIDFGEEPVQQTGKAEYIKNAGLIHGTMYHATYEHPQGLDIQQDIEKKMLAFDQSLSTYKENSIISRINKNEKDVETDAHFENVFFTASYISEKTDGAFDLTVAPLVNLWGFGFDPSDAATLPQQTQIDSILAFTGYQKIQLKRHRLIKDDPRIMLDANAIAKGYSVDLVASFLADQGIENYMIEIGGEIVVKGESPKGKKWLVGVDKPIEDPSALNREIQRVIALDNNALATSGNYRQFYEKDGKKYSHTIDPKTGYPVNHNLLSATVIGPDCMTADAFATACMVMGVEKSLKVAEQEEHIEIYLIFENEKGEMDETFTKGFEKYFNQP